MPSVATTLAQQSRPPNPGNEPLDPAKEANAQRTRLEMGMTSYPAEYAKDGKDWEVEQVRQAESLGLDVETYRLLLTSKLYGTVMTQPTSGVVENEEQEESED